MVQWIMLEGYFKNDASNLKETRGVSKVLQGCFGDHLIIFQGDFQDGQLLL